ncbi:MAG: Imidazoleglycerol-phosphate dehydratase [Oscillospiraceae bacterium]|jgi:imidazoleglycerol-phosphate dehydratase|nr:Imidazoleglycerol-phosphate dehydratase [Oscillospiraceae bacterium]
MRNVTITRKTKETDIVLSLNLDGMGKADINTGVGFFDHMLTAFAVHSGIDLSVVCKGDLEVDCHHTVEDVGIVLGQAFLQAVGDRAGIARFGHFMLPMDEALAMAAIDISGRAYLVFDADFKNANIGAMDTQMVEEFWRAFAMNAAVTLHLKLLYGSNDHHKVEAIFKAAAHAVKLAIVVQKEKVVLSTKGCL